ncbi:ATP-dependent DNA helicase [Alkaliphilus peptidifermentans]|uniref:DNA excision repair protein ERCC-2 n=1 Tax=Alkaliphilus peptidifermentans DSM 18978 TaxID=1120976 RepID=A0A1G5FHU5_9FIRM|nr:ATP-dependent DNA helicase [Alkaliphilus peptidifermentans]SCY38737.1 DNA excision repair protein ERCC-2 [Alkaliphilus peptidifermentans DSM 18978]
MTKEINISIRNMVELILRGGDLNLSFAGPNRALEGTRGHQKIQRSYGAEDEAEVTLKHQLKYDEFLFNFSGRIDGILTIDGCTVVDEIKTITMPIEELTDEFNMLHWAQVKCYGYIYATENQLDKIDLQLTYYQLKTEEIKRFRRTFSHEELKDFFYSLIEKYIVWADLINQWEEKRNLSAKALKFPFNTYRKGQRKLAVSVYQTIKEKKKIFVQAPTGIGKTMSTIFPAIKAMGEGKTSKIFYLTAKTITRQVAEEAVDKLRVEGLHFKSVTITAKDKICFEKTKSCTPDECQYAKGYFNRLNDALKEIIEEEAFDRITIEDYAKKYNLCPFEFSLELSLWADCIICDYNYVFDPRVYLKRFFVEYGGDYTFLIDEAHNLVERARMMFSAELYKGRFLEEKKYIKNKSKDIAKALEKINKYMLNMKKLYGDDESYAQKDEPSEIYPLLRKFIEECDYYFTENKGEEIREEFLQLYFDSIAFVKIAEFYDLNYVTYVERAGKDTKLKIFCLDPSKLLREALKRGRSAIFFSATLTPIEYFRNVLGGEEGDYSLLLDSPFDSKKLCLLIAGDISTRYYDREKSYNDIAQYIKKIIEIKPGNYLIFFPSYKYLESVVEIFSTHNSTYNILVQAPYMTEEEREVFLDKFQHQNGECYLGFCVLGGIFSEGIDLIGTRLLGSIIIGVGLPQICLETNLIKDYYQEKYQKGYEYGFKYPGMNKVLQAAGRVIRTEEDTGTVLLIDDRYLTNSYKKIFPKYWNNIDVISKKNIENKLIDFWGE